MKLLIDILPVVAGVGVVLVVVLNVALVVRTLGGSQLAALILEVLLGGPAGFATWKFYRLWGQQIERG